MTEEIELLFPIIDEPKNGSGEIVFILTSDAVDIIRNLLIHMIKKKMIPYLRNSCGNTIEEECVYTAMVELPWADQAKQAIEIELSTSGKLIFDPNLLRLFLLDQGFTQVDHGGARIIMRVVQWVAFIIYQSIQYYLQHIIGKKKLVNSILVLEAIRENEILADILRGCVLN